MIDARPGRRTKVALAAVALAALGVLPGCGAGAGGPPGDRIAGHTLTIYVSVPMEGASRVSGQAIINGAQLALARARSRVGSYRIAFKRLDDATPQRAQWDPGVTTQNARTAVNDRTTIGYIGELDSGASAISIPLLNRAGIAQISPSSTSVGLTSSAPGASPGEPQKYYPTGTRTYARVVPNDAVQAVVQVSLQRSMGCVATYVLEDGGVDGDDTASSFDAFAQTGGLRVIATQVFQRGAADYSSLAASVARSGADCVLVSAIPESGAALLTKQVAAALPNARIFGSAGLAESTYADPAQGGIPTSIDPRVLITVATLAPSAYPAAGRQFMLTYSQLYGMPQPAAIDGYEAMSLLLAAIGRATHGGTKTARRSNVVAAVFATRNRRSVLGTYSIDHDGDTTLTRYGVYRVVAGRLSFWKAVEG
ncbi:MAG: branched-chain amino acid ABC transporter substrate-binding protein [Solirubrobacterales bacterium]|nr:branched-chain amino acid ABC transporter substrate-binding protein [Solirubrobacterales bacterium]